MNVEPWLNQDVKIIVKSKDGINYTGSYVGYITTENDLVSPREMAQVIQGVTKALEGK